jgi:hypothetical protein
MEVHIIEGGHNPITMICVSQNTEKELYDKTQGSVVLFAKK